MLPSASEAGLDESDALGVRASGAGGAQPVALLGFGLGGLVVEAAGAPHREVHRARGRGEGEPPRADLQPRLLGPGRRRGYVYGPEDARGRFLTSLRFELPEDLVEVTGEAYGGDLSEERMDLLDVDAIVWLDVPVDRPDSLSTDSLRVHTEAPARCSSTASTTPSAERRPSSPRLSLPFLLDGLVPQLALAIDGDPATAVVAP